MNRKVKDISVNKNTTLLDLIKQYDESCAFNAKHLAEAYEIITEALDNKSFFVMSITANLISTGIRGIVKELLKRHVIDLLITTCGTWDHDIARSLGYYEHGRFELNDAEVKDQGYARLGNVLVPMEFYANGVEKFMQELLSDLYDKGKKEICSYELSWEIGKKLDSEDSMFYWAYKNKIPVVVPGFYDGAVGSQVFFFQEQHKDFIVNLYKDEKLLSDIFFDRSRPFLGVCVGGGISKHHLIWWSQFRDGLDYCVYFTSAQESDGSLSGARPREAISWNKLKAKSRFVTVEADASITLPLVFGAILD